MDIMQFPPVSQIHIVHSMPGGYLRVLLLNIILGATLLGLPHVMLVLGGSLE